MKKYAVFILCLLRVAVFAQPGKTVIRNRAFTITLAPLPGVLWQYRLAGAGKEMNIRPPRFEIDRKLLTADVDAFRLRGQDTLRNGVTVFIAEGRFRADSSLHLSIEFHIAKDNPVVRFRYILTGNSPHRFTKKNGVDDLCYFSVSFAAAKFVKEIRLSDFNEKEHCTTLSENNIDNRFFEDSQSVMGPIFIGGNAGRTFLVAYEHGSMNPDRFVDFRLSKNRDVLLEAVKGNYLDGQLFDENARYQSIWFEIAAVSGDEDKMAAAYRSFILKYISENTESRKPYIYYNTWGRQERTKWAGGSYLSSMNLETTLQEIEVAHQMGIEVYVLDVGWFQKTGDWQVNTAFFPDSLRKVKALLDKYQMKLGLWLNPLLAAKTSDILAQNKQNVVVWNGKADDPFPIWETEASVRLSLVGPYWVSFADKLTSLIKDYGVSYFKWDGIEQVAANGVGQYYGSEKNTAKEREESYAFQLPHYMNLIVDRVSEAYPNVIFDFDITEGGRSVGLQFLSSGKYFIMNNGPYFHNYDLAPMWGSLYPNGNANIFVNPGPARGWFARSVLAYDKWIPSVLFLTHYQPDGPENSQLINLASLILGQNGLWGQLLEVTPEDIRFIHSILSKYKQIRDDVTESNPVVTGEPGLSPEIHEKINAVTGRGAVVVFANATGDYTYITRNKVDRRNWRNDGVTVKYDKEGRAIIHMNFTQGSAKIIFFGVE